MNTQQNIPGKNSGNQTVKIDSDDIKTMTEGADDEVNFDSDYDVEANPSREVDDQQQNLGGEKAAQGVGRQGSAQG